MAVAAETAGAAWGCDRFPAGAVVGATLDVAALRQAIRRNRQIPGAT
jgi:hypothetical protein